MSAENDYNYGVWNATGRRNAGDLEKRYDQQLAAVAGAGFRENQRLGGTRENSIAAANEWADNFLATIAPEQFRKQRENDFNYGVINASGIRDQLTGGVAGSKALAWDTYAQTAGATYRATGSLDKVRENLGGVSEAFKKSNETTFWDGVKMLPKTTFGKIWLGAATLGAGVAVAGAAGVASALPAIGTGTGAAIGTGLVNAGKDAIIGGAKETVNNITNPAAPAQLAPAPALSSYLAPGAPSGSQSPLGTQGGAMIAPVIVIAGLGLVGFIIARRKK